MVLFTTALFYLAAYGLVLAAAAVACHAVTERPAWLTAAHALTVVSLVAATAQIGARWATWGLLPFTTTSDSLVLFLVMSAAIAIVITRHERMRITLVFYTPALALLAVIAVGVGTGHLTEAPRPLSGLFLAVHVGLAILAYALFFIASITSLAYVFQARQLKRKQRGVLMQRMPALERLDTVLFRLISAGYPLFVITLILGVIWAWLDRDLLGEYWWISPKIVLSVVMVLFYAVSFNGRLVGWLRGRKLAYFVFCGFTFLLALYIGMGVLGLRDYNFWVATP